MKFKKIETDKGTLKFGELKSDFTIDSNADVCNVTLNDKQILNLIVYMEEWGPCGFEAYDPERQSPADAVNLGEDRKTAMTKLKALVEMVF